MVGTAIGLILFGGAVACGETATEVVLGTVSLTVIGLDPSAIQNGGVVTISGPSLEQPLVVTLDVTGTRQEDVPAGSYLGTYAPPDGFVLLDAATKTVTVVGGETVSVTWEVAEIEQLGTLEVTITGLGGATEGGSILVTGISVPGVEFQPTTYDIDASGILQVSLPVGTFSVEYAPPAGFDVDTGTQNPETVTIDDGQTANVEFAVTASPGGGVPGDIYDFGFEGGDDSTASGDFVSGGVKPFVPNTPWVRDASVSVEGSQSVRQDYPQSTGNVGEAFFYQLSSDRQSVYIRFAHRQETGADNSAPWKILRVTETFAGQRIVNIIFNQGANTYTLFFTTLDPGAGPYVANTNLPVPTPNDARGTWVWHELFVDVTGNEVVVKYWIDDTLYFDYTLVDSADEHDKIRAFQFDGTINSLVSATSAWFDEIGFSSQRMGIP